MNRPTRLQGTMYLCLALALGAGGTLIGSAPGAEMPQVDLAEWTPPDIRTLGEDPFGKLVKYGHALMVDTANQIGPSVSDPAKRLSGNNLNCQSCHLKAGTQPYSMPLTGVWGQFPQYRGREGEVGSLEERINGCMDRSMNGRALPLDGPEMKAFLAYMKWLSTGIPDGAKLTGAGTMGIKAPDRAVDLGWPRQARHHRKRLPVPAPMGARQLQQRRRHDPRAHRCSLCAAQHAVRHHLRRPGAHRRRCL
jgi:cytochrome c